MMVTWSPQEAWAVAGAHHPAASSAVISAAKGRSRDLADAALMPQEQARRRFLFSNNYTTHHVNATEKL
jgi:hypothetical protein